jgi:hypothetical protein
MNENPRRRFPGPAAEVGKSAQHHLQPPEKWNYSLPLTGEGRLLVIWEKTALSQEV